MAHGYGFWTFGWIAAEREAARVDRFNERWHRLTAIHQKIAADFLPALAAVQLSSEESTRILDCFGALTEWQNAINAKVNNARQNHLARYASAIKAAATQVLRSCKKHTLLGIQDFAYDAQRKMVTANGTDLYYLG